MSDLDQLLNSMKMKGSGSDKPAAGALAAVPPIPAGLDPDVARILRPMREALLQLPETIRDNEGGGKGGPATSISPDVLVGAGVDPGAIKPSGPPVRPSGFQAQGAMTTIILSWSKQPDNVLAEVWTAAADDMTQAVLVERTASAIYSHSLGTNATRFYWLRFYQGGLAGDWYAQAGLKASTGSIDPVLDQLKGGGITSDMIKALDSAKLVGSLKDWQIEAVNAAKLVGALKDSQIEAIDVNKLKGQIQPQQIAGIDVTKLAGQIESAQIKTLDAIKITGELSEAQVKTVSDGLRSTMAANKAEADRQLATLTDSDKAMAARVDGLSTTVNTDRAAAQAGISEAKTAAADAKQSGAQSIDKLNARLDPKGDIGGAIAGKAEQKALDASLTRLAAVEVECSLAW
ncbi:hypothetical protein AA0N74_07800 [Chromobacterium vaccinii]|uniref:hypothetical protein n=1 Tax=Chromobacterium vaccinii TaxID=1108595 RepID=UPI0031E11A2A